MKFKCPTCSKNYVFPTEKVKKGLKFQCKSCSEIIDVYKAGVLFEKNSQKPDYLWYFLKDGTQRGPLSTEAISSRFKAGALEASALVWREGFGKNWLQLRETEIYVDEQTPESKKIVSGPPPIPKPKKTVESLVLDKSTEKVSPFSVPVSSTSKMQNIFGLASPEKKLDQVEVAKKAEPAISDEVAGSLKSSGEPPGEELPTKKSAAAEQLKPHIKPLSQYFMLASILSFLFAFFLGFIVLLQLIGTLSGSVDIMVPLWNLVVTFVYVWIGIGLLRAKKRAIDWAIGSNIFNIIAFAVKIIQGVPLFFAVPLGVLAAVIFVLVLMGRREVDIWDLERPSAALGFKELFQNKKLLIGVGSFLGVVISVASIFLLVNLLFSDSESKTEVNKSELNKPIDFSEKGDTDYTLFKEFMFGTPREKMSGIKGATGCDDLDSPSSICVYNYLFLDIDWIIQFEFTDNRLGAVSLLTSFDTDKHERISTAIISRHHLIAIMSQGNTLDLIQLNNTVKDEAGIFKKISEYEQAALQASDITYVFVEKSQSILTLASNSVGFLAFFKAVEVDFREIDYSLYTDGEGSTWCQLSFSKPKLYLKEIQSKSNKIEKF